VALDPVLGDPVLSDPVPGDGARRDRFDQLVGRLGSVHAQMTVPDGRSVQLVTQPYRSVTAERFVV